MLGILEKCKNHTKYWGCRKIYYAIDTDDNVRYTDLVFIHFTDILLTPPTSLDYTEIK